MHWLDVTALFFVGALLIGLFVWLVTMWALLFEHYTEPTLFGTIIIGLALWRAVVFLFDRL